MALVPFSARKTPTTRAAARPRPARLRVQAQPVIGAVSEAGLVLWVDETKLQRRTDPGAQS